MKMKTLVCAALPAALFFTSYLDAGGKEIAWTGQTDSKWNTAANWSDGSPGLNDTVVFDNRIQANWTSTAEVTRTILGVRVANVTTDILINPSPGTLTIGTGGIDMSAAEKDLTWRFASNDRLAFSGAQDWDIASGRTFTITADTATKTLNVAVGGNITKKGTGTVVINAGTVFGSTNTGDKTTGALNITAGKVLVQTGNTSTAKVGILSNVTVEKLGTLEFRRDNSTSTITSSGTITLAGFDSWTPTEDPRAVGSTILLSGSVASTFDLKIDGSGIIENNRNDKKEHTLTGRITGTATDNIVFRLTQANHLHLTGDNSEFAGQFSIWDGRNVYIDSATAGSAAATWNAGNLATGANYIVNASNAAFGAVNLSHNGTFSVESTASNVQIGDVAITASSAGNIPTLTIKGNDTVIKSVTMARSGGANTAFTVSGTGTKVGAITMNDGSVTHTLTVDAGKDLTVTKTGGGTGDFVMNHSGTKTLKLNGMLTVENELVSGNGTVNYNLGTNGVLNAVKHKVNSATATITGGTSNFDTLEFSTYSGSLTLASGRMNIGSGITAGTAGTINLGTATVGAYGDWKGAKDMTLQTGATTTFDTLDSKDGETARTITLTGVLSGDGALTKTGKGTLILSGTNTYTGATTVNGGILELAAGSLTSHVTVNAGGTLAGTGTIGTAAGAKNLIAGTGATISPGTAATTGTLTINGAANFAGATVKLKLDASTTDVIVATSIAGLDTADIQISLLAGTGGSLIGEYELFKADSIAGWTEKLAGKVVDVAGLSDEYVATWSATAGQLSIQAIPEPSTYALLGGLAAAGVALVARRRNRK